MYVTDLSVINAHSFNENKILITHLEDTRIYMSTSENTNDWSLASDFTSVRSLIPGWE